MDASQNPEILKMNGFRFFQSETKKLLIKKKQQNKFRELLMIVSETFNKDDPPRPPETPNLDFSPDFQDFLKKIRLSLCDPSIVNLTNH